MNIFFLLAFPVLMLSITIASVLMLFRNNWVFYQRMRLNKECFESRRGRISKGDLTVTDEPWYDENYLTYNQMMLRFWVWDIEKLRKPGR